MMAVDTEDKRRSVLNLLIPFLAMPEPDNDMTQADRIHVGRIYRDPVIVTGVPPAYIIRQPGGRG